MMVSMKEKRARNVQFIGFSVPNVLGRRKSEYEVHTDDDCHSHLVEMTDEEYKKYQDISWDGHEHPKWEQMQRFLRKKTNRIDWARRKKTFIHPIIYK